MSYISDCCGAEICADGFDLEICPECLEHCEVVDEDEPEEDGFEIEEEIL